MSRDPPAAGHGVVDRFVGQLGELRAGCQPAQLHSPPILINIYPNAFYKAFTTRRRPLGVVFHDRSHRIRRHRSR
jgi:hypothetical protein